MCINEDNTKKKKKNKSHSKSRTKTRKPKYLSLSKHMELPEKPSPETQITEMTSHQQKQQLNLFPLHPELINDKSSLLFSDDHHDENDVALLFDSESTAGDASLTGLLRPSPEHERSPSSYERAYDSESLVRAAMKRRNDNDEEKWVCYSEVVEEVTSSSSKNAVVLGRRSSSNNNNKKKRKLSLKAETASSNSEGNSVISGKSCSSTTSLALKLDYDGILNAWSDKGPLYIQTNQTVPDLLHCDHHGLTEGGWGSSVGNLWKVPENDDIKIKEEPEGWKLGQREASVLRYKEKRQNRLFSKKIRYEVRKVNAEKRPRMKGRFVKTC